MPATLVWGKSFYVDEHDEVVGVEGGFDFLSWTSVIEMQELASNHGVAMELWPVYPEIEVERAVPLAEAQMRSSILRDALEAIPSEIVEANYWLGYVLRVLRQGHAFFIMV